VSQQRVRRYSMTVALHREIARTCAALWLLSAHTAIDNEGERDPILITSPDLPETAHCLL